MSKKCAALWREAHLDVKSVKNCRSGSTFRSWDVENTALWREAHFESKVWKTQISVGRSDVVLCGRWSGLWLKREVLQHFQNDGRAWEIEEDLHKCIFCGRRSSRGIFSRDVRSSRSWFRTDKHGWTDREIERRTWWWIVVDMDRWRDGRKKKLTERSKWIFLVRARCLSASLRSSVLLADQRGIEPPPAVCQRRKSAAIPTAPRGRLGEK